jgi:formiminotetrahydrofolate cyclodeaminase
VLSDIATGTTLATSAGTGASWMVRVNLYSLKDQELVNRLNGRLEKALQTMTTTSQQVVETVEKRMR